MSSSRADTKSPNRISRYLVKEIKHLKRTKTYVSNRKGFLISDSKSKDLKYLKGKKYISFYYKGGADINNAEVQSYAKYVVLNKRVKYPVLIFWFGTCSFTQKANNGLFEIKDNLDSVVTEVITSYKDTRDKLLKLNPRAKIVFLECPYYSLANFNHFRRKNLKKNHFIEQQRNLNSAIDSHNQQVRILCKSSKIPNFNNDFCTRVHRKKRRPRRVIDFKQLRDGCHMGHLLAELWLIRIQRMVYRI